MLPIHVLIAAVSPTHPLSLSVDEKGGASTKVIDGAIHLWSDGEAPFPYDTPPPRELQKSASIVQYFGKAVLAGVSGALVVQPSAHLYDHSYVTSALKAYPRFFRGVALADPTLPAAEAVAFLEARHSEGFAGIRFNADNFVDQGSGLYSETARAYFKRAGELQMPVSILAYTGLAKHLVDLLSLTAEFKNTSLVIDHLGCFRQPASGGLLYQNASSDNENFHAVVILGNNQPQVYAKISALFRISKLPPPHLDLKWRVSSLLNTYGGSRLIWGSDFPYVLKGGQECCTPDAMSYEDAVAVPSFWKVEEWDTYEAGEYDDMMGGTVARLYGFNN